MSQNKYVHRVYKPVSQIQLIQSDADEFISKVVKTVENACTLIEDGYEYVTEFPEEGVKIFRKRK